jgi:RNA polymerase sigma factor (sigma-70 family)
MAEDENRDPQEAAEGSGAAARPADAAVRRALVEGRRDLLSYLIRRVGNADDAQEVLQRFVSRALERSNDLRDVRTVRGWLARVLATTVADWQRMRVMSRRREVPLDETNAATLASASEAEADEAVCNCLYKILPTLKPEYAEVIWRADLLREPRDRIAVSLGTTVNNVTVRLHRGRQALKKRLEETCLGCPEHGFLDCSCEPGDAGAAWPTATLERRAAECREQARMTEPAARPRRKSSPRGQGGGRAKQSRTGERED